MDSGHGHFRRGKDAPIINYTDFVNICKGGIVKFSGFYNKKTPPKGRGCPLKGGIKGTYATRRMEMVTIFWPSAVAVSAALVLIVSVAPSATRISA